MTNSHIDKVAVITQYNAKSLTEHLNSSKWWNFGRKQGGLFVFTPTITAQNSFWYRGTADAMYQNISFLKNSHEPYVIIASGDGVYKMDYNQVLEYHIKRNADITVVCTTVQDTKEACRFGVVTTDEMNKIVDFKEKPLIANSRLVSTGVIVIRRRQLIELLEAAALEERYHFVEDILIRYLHVKNVYAYKLDTYWSNISTVESYYKTNMDFLKKEIRDYFFRKYPDIYSKVEDLPPAKYNMSSLVRNSIISSGCIINGSVENSVLFRKVYIGNNCIIKNSIIFDDVFIEDNSYIENCIIESKNTIRANTKRVGESGRINIIAEDIMRYSI